MHSGLIRESMEIETPCGTIEETTYREDIVITIITNRTVTCCFIH